MELYLDGSQQISTDLALLFYYVNPCNCHNYNDILFSILFYARLNLDIKCRPPGCAPGVPSKSHIRKPLSARAACITPVQGTQHNRPQIGNWGATELGLSVAVTRYCAL